MTVKSKKSQKGIILTNSNTSPTEEGELLLVNNSLEVYSGGSANPIGSGGGSVSVSSGTADNNVTNVDISGFIFDKTVNMAGRYSYSCYRKTDTTEVIEVGTLHIGNKLSGDTLVITDFPGGDDAGISF